MTSVGHWIWPTGGMTMTSIAHVFVLNLLTSVDNAVIIGSMIRQTQGARKWILIFCAVVLLTLDRTLSSFAIGSFIGATGLRLFLGFVILLVSFVLSQADLIWRREPSILQLCLIFMVTDMALSLDNIAGVAGITTDPIQITLGILLSVIPLVMLVPMFHQIFEHAPQVQTFANGMMWVIGTNIALGDPAVHRWFGSIPHPTAEYVSTALFIIVYGAVHLFRRNANP